MSTLSVSLNKTNDLKALVFDLIYERHSGVIVYIRVFQGELITGQKIKFLNPIDKPSFTIYKIEQLGVNSPDKKIKEKLNVGEIG